MANWDVKVSEKVRSISAYIRAAVTGATVSAGTVRSEGEQYYYKTFNSALNYITIGFLRVLWVSSLLLYH